MAIISLLINLIELYQLIMLAWVIGSWFPQLQGNPIYRWIDSVVFPYAKLFRGLIPPIGGFDFSIIIAFIVLNLIQFILARLASGMLVT
jgi:uncharacterized protein YggT (Ycf19 family)